MNIILNYRLGGSRCIVKSVLGEKLKGFPTQRAALEEEDQLRWVGGFSSQALLVQVLRVTLIAVCTWVEETSPWIGCLVLSWILVLPWFFACKLRSEVVGG